MGAVEGDGILDQVSSTLSGMTDVDGVVNTMRILRLSSSGGGLIERTNAPGVTAARHAPPGKWGEHAHR